MSVVLQREALGAPFVAWLASQDPPLTADMPNRKFDKPPTGPWLRFTIVNVREAQLEMGDPTTNTHRDLGSLIIQVFVPANSGDGAALVLGDSLATLYRQQKFLYTDMPSSGHVRMRDPNVRVIGRTDAYFQVNVTIPFQADSIP